MKRRTYMRPTMMAEKFIAQEFCAVCETITNVTVETISAGQGYFAKDLDMDGIFDDSEKGNGNIHQINPQGGLLEMTGDEYQNKYLQEREQGFYWSGSQENYVNGYSLVWGYAQKGNSLSGQGAFAIETKTIEHIYKNQS